MRVHLLNLGTSYYALLDNDPPRRLSYAQYQALADFQNGLIPEEEILEKIGKYEAGQELTQCPVCGHWLPQGVIEQLEELGGGDQEWYHRMLKHRPFRDYIPFEGQPVASPERTAEELYGLPSR